MYSATGSAERLGFQYLCPPLYLCVLLYRAQLTERWHVCVCLPPTHSHPLKNKLVPIGIALDGLVFGTEYSKLQ